MDSPAIERALAQLAPSERRAVEIVYGDGRELGEAARLLGVSAQTVSRHLAVAYRVVGRQLLEPDTPAADTVTRFAPVTIRPGAHRAP